MSNYSKLLRKLLIIIFFGLACSTILAASIFWGRDFPNRNGLELSPRTPVGGDFLAFYNAGRVFDRDPAQLYNFDIQWDVQREIFKNHPIIASRPLPFVYPPLVAIPFQYLSRIEFSNAFVLWAGIGTLVYIIALLILGSVLEEKTSHKLAIVLLGLGFAPFTALSIISGHMSFIGVFVFTTVFWALRNQQSFLAGLLLSLSYYKPPLFLVFVVFSFFQRDCRLIGGFLLGGITLTGLSIAIVGWPTFLFYLQQLPNYRYGGQVNAGIVFVPKQGAGLLSAITALLPGQYDQARKIFLVVAAIVVAWVIYKFPKRASGDSAFAIQFALQVSLSLLLSLQMVDYDLSLLIVPILIVGSTLWREKESTAWFLSMLIIFVVYNGWSFDNYFIANFESLYSASLVGIWIMFLMILLTSGRFRCVTSRLD